MNKVKEYRSFLCSLSEASRDKENHESLIDDDDLDHRVVNFDGVRKNFIEGKTHVRAMRIWKKIISGF